MDVLEVTILLPCVNVHLVVHRNSWQALVPGTFLGSSSWRCLGLVNLGNLLDVLNWRRSLLMHLLLLHVLRGHLGVVLHRRRSLLLMVLNWRRSLLLMVHLLLLLLLHVLWRNLGMVLNRWWLLLVILDGRRLLELLLTIRYEVQKVRFLKKVAFGLKCEFFNFSIHTICQANHRK